MSTIIRDNIKDLANEVTNLKKDFVNKIKTDKLGAEDLIGVMRFLHGNGIYIDEKDKLNIIKKDIKDINRDDLIKLSINASLLHCIHHSIRACETKAYAQKSEHGLGKQLLSSETDIQTATQSGETKTSEFTKPLQGVKETSLVNALTNKNKKTAENNLTAIIKKNSDKTDEISITKIKSESSVDPQSFKRSDLFSETETKSQKQLGGDTDYFLQNLTTEQAERLRSEFERNQKGGNGGTNVVQKFDVNKPTLVNFWANWCGYSTTFKKHWDKFKETATAKYPGLQVTELDVGRDSDLNEIAKKVGVTGFPTLGLFHNKKIKCKVAGKAEVEHINEFINSVLSAN